MGQEVIDLAGTQNCAMCDDRAMKRTERMVLALGYSLNWHSILEREVAAIDSCPAGSATIVERLERSMAAAIAVREVLVGAEACRKARKGVERGRVTALINEFDSAVPDSKDVRDVLSHYDDYLAGEGRLQNKGPGARRVVDLNRWFEHGAEGASLVLASRADGSLLRLNVHDALTASAALIDELDRTLRD